MKKLLSGLAVIWLTTASLFSYSALYVLGDSLSDTGNNNSLANDTRYWRGRTSNGPMWPEILSNWLLFNYSQGNNKAFSSATTYDQPNIPGIMSQVNALPNPLQPNGLTVMWIGLNDIQGSTAETYATQSQQALNNISTAIDSLYAKGARTIVVSNVYDVTVTPHYVINVSAAMRTTISNWITDFNTRLDTLLASLRTRYPLLRLVGVDLRFNLILMFVFGPQIDIPNPFFGIGYNDPAFTSGHDFGVGEYYATWDGLHPTSKLHRNIAALIYFASQ